MEKYKVSGGALQYVLLIAIVVALFIAAFLMLTDFFLQKKQVSFLYKEASIYNLEHTFESLSSLSQNTINFDSYGVHGETSVGTSDWGIFELLIAKTKLKNQEFNRIALVGGYRPDIDKALYLTDNYHALTLVGATKVVGNAFVPVLGVKSGYVDGESFYFEKYVNGNLFHSEKKVPKIETRFEWFSKGVTVPPSEFTGMFVNSFYNEKKVFYGGAVVKLERMSLKGAIQVEANQRIEVYPSANLQDVVLKAPEIIIHKNVKGSFQCFATQKIEVKENVDLSYPSALVCSYKNQEDRKKNFFKKISIDKGVKINGVVLYTESPQKIDQNTDVLIEKDAFVKGEVYCKGNVEHRGVIHGVATVDRFIYRSGSSTYMNMLYHATIDVTKLPKQYVGIFHKESAKKGVAKWLY